MKIRRRGKQERRAAPRGLGAGRAIVLLVVATAFAAACGPGGPAPPETRRDDVVETLHGVEIADPYRWLEDTDSATARAWWAEQAEHARRVLDAAPAGVDPRARLAELYDAPWTSAPIRRGGRTFFARRAAGEKLAWLYVREPDGRERLLVDPRDIAADVDVSVGYSDVAVDGALIAYRVRRDGEREVEIRFHDVARDQPLDDVLPRGRYGNVSIDADGRGAFYDRMTADGERVLHHAFGDDPATDRIVFGTAHPPDTLIRSRLYSNGRYLLVTASHGAASRRDELWFQDTWAGAQVHPIAVGIPASFTAAVGGDTVFLLTDWEAPRGRVLAANLRQPAPDSWTEIIPQGDDVIDGITAAGGRLLVRRRRDLRPRLTVHEPDGFPVREVDLPGGIGALGPIGGGTWEHDEVFFAHSSPIRPATVFRYRVSDGARTVWAEPPVPFAPDGFVLTRVEYAADDGTEVPMVLAYPAGMTPDGTQRALLSADGGFGAPIEPGFDPLVAVWMERGGVWALPAVRGGGELGADWHRAGMREDKPRAVDDLVGAAEWLIDAGLTRAERLALRGTTGAGVLVGAALTRRPGLFGAAVAHDPLTDMLRYHLHPRGAAWTSEYGTSDDPRLFEVLAGYSPYHRVAPGTRYPAVMLVSRADDGSQAAKMTAKMQHATRSGRPVLLVRHGGSAPIGERPTRALVDELADELRFLLWQTR